MDTQSPHRDTPESYVYLAVIDLECTCDNESDFGPSEIIEIGTILGKLSAEAFETVAELQIYVRPIINPTLTDFCTGLTGISQATVDSSATLDYALPVLKNCLQANDVTAWVSWGKFDANQFMRECELKLLRNPMADMQHLNVKQLFARKFGHRVGLNRALELRGLGFAGRPHSGVDDAKNIARLLSLEELLRGAILKRTAIP